ncbi:hypothetical protein BGX23_005133 [Mortierella sp. AD031]|nr:hypothetical protein BGX23_005133 [Mortierella sp. AD031]
MVDDHGFFRQGVSHGHGWDTDATFTITVNGIASKTFEWVTSPKTATLDRLRMVMHGKHPTLSDRSQTIAYEHNDAPGFIFTDNDLRVRVRIAIREGRQHLYMRLEDPQKPFSDITHDDTFRIYGVDPPQPFEDSIGSVPFTSDKHKQALDNLYITLEAAVTSMPPGDGSGCQYYTNAFLMHAVALFPELKLKPDKDISGRRAYGILHYAVESKADSSQMLAVTEFDSVEWYFQQCILDKQEKIGYNFPTIRSSQAPTMLKFTTDKDNWRVAAKTIFGHVVWQLEKMVEDITNQNKRRKTETEQ